MRALRLRTTIGAAAVAVALTAAGTPAAAGTYINTVAPTATVTGDGHRVEVTLIVACDAGERARFGVRIVQDGRAGTGQGAGRCSGDEQRFTVTVTPSDGTTFVAGQATAAAWLDLRHGQHRHPRHRWSQDITVE